MRRLAVLLCLAVMCCITAFAGTISLQPSATTLTLGTPLTLDVNVSGLSDLYAFQFDISFDPAMLSGTGVAEGVLFGGVGVFFSPGFIDNIGGSITFIGDSLSGPGPGISTDGTLATIIFNSIGAGSSGISLANVVLLDSNLGDISATGSGTSVSVIAGGSAVPEPATFVLLLSAIAALGAGSLFRLVPKAL